MAFSDLFNKAMKPTKLLLVDTTKAFGTAAKASFWTAPKTLHSAAAGAFSKKGLGIAAAIIGTLAAAKGISEWSSRNKIETSQMQEAEDLKASIAANRAARIETSAEMGQGETLAYRNDWGQRVKGGIPGQQTTV